MPKSGEIVQQSGIYKCSIFKNEVTCVKGEPFPPCCKGNTLYTGKSHKVVILSGWPYSFLKK